MSVLILPRRFYGQPQANVAPANDAFGLISPGATGRVPLAVSGTVTRKAFRKGDSLVLASGAVVEAQDRTAVGLTRMTIVCLADSTVPGGPGAVLQYGNWTSGGDIGYQIYISTWGVWQVAVGGPSVWQSAVVNSAYGLSTGDVAVVTIDAARSAGQLKLFTKSGVETSATNDFVSVGLGVGNGFARLEFGGGNTGLLLGYVLPFCLPDDMARQAVDDPYLFLRRPGGLAAYAFAAGGSSAEIAGTQSGAGAQSGAIVTAIQGAGVQIGLGSQSGALSTAITMAGTVSGVGTQAGDILTKIEIDGDQLGAGLQALSLATGISVAGILAGEGAASGGIVTTITITGQQLADSLITGGIANSISIAGQQVGAGTQAGQLGGGPALIGGSQAGAGAQSLVLSTSITLTGQQIADAILAGSLTTEIRIGAAQNGVGVMSGAMDTVISVSGTVSGAGVASWTEHEQPSRFYTHGGVFVRQAVRNVFVRQAVRNVFVRDKTPTIFVKGH